MKSVELKLSRIGNSRGIRLPAELIQKYNLEKTVILEERPHELALRPKHRKKLTWKETYRQMAVAAENWSDLDASLQDGLD